MNVRDKLYVAIGGAQGIGLALVHAVFLQAPAGRAAGDRDSGHDHQQPARLDHWQPAMIGTQLEIRKIEPGDKAALAAAVDQSSNDAIYRRFLNPHGRLTAAELRYLTEVDHRDHEALLAVDRASNEGVGVARYVRDRERRDSAEIAVAVLEPWQGRGVGKALLNRLADRARDEGITRFTALMLSANRPMRCLLADLGATRLLRSGEGTVELAVELTPKEGEN